jgi:glycosyltransferase involved in cell wall biosynthesis
MNDPHSPEISVVIVTPDHYNTIRKTIRHLRAQTVRDKLEIVIVAPSAERLALDVSELKDFFRFLVVEVGKIESTGEAVAAGVHNASAPVVTYVEEHVYPAQGWAEALIRAHQESWAAVGAVLYNANPGSMISWASLFTDFGPWVEQPLAAETRGLAPHQTSYKRPILLDYGTELGAMLEIETILHWDLISKGYRLYLEPAAKVSHLNPSLLSSYLISEFHGGRLFGAARTRYENWSPWRRLLYIGAMPLIPIIRFRRVLKEISRTRLKTNLLPSILPALIIGIISHSIGECTAYAIGVGDAPKRRLTIELERHRHVREKENE